MNKILKLYDKQYVIKLLTKRLLPHYPDFIKVEDVEIKKYKNNVWDHTYHVVVGFETILVNKRGKRVKLPIFCSAHSSEPRKNVYTALKYLWKHSFASNHLTIPHPLFYSKYFNATFYRGVEGNNLYYYIREKNFKEIERIIPQAARWFSKLHNLSTTSAINFNEENSRIETVFPGVAHILEKIKEIYPSKYKIYKKIYQVLVKNEKKFLKDDNQKFLVHGDAHPENIIKMSKLKLAVIDFTDLCLADFARDLGSFLQQLEYMSNRKIGDLKYTQKIKKLFLDNYFKNANIKLDKSLEKRIDIYYNWTATRTATYFLLKYKPEPDRALELQEMICKNLGIIIKL